MKSHFIFNVIFGVIISMILMATYNLWMDTVSATTPPVTGAVPKPRDFIISLPWSAGRSASIVGFGYLEETHMNKDAHALDFGITSGTGGSLGEGKDVRAIAPGTVVWAGAHPGPSTFKCLGNSVVISHIGPGTSYSSLYAHLATIESNIVVGASIARHQKLGTEGNSGSGLSDCRTFPEHLHFVLYKDANTGTQQNPHLPYSATPVVPEPMVGEQLYEGFGLRWGNHSKWAGPLTATSLGNDSVVGPPGGNWGNGSTINGSTISVGQPVNFVINGLPTDTKEVRLTIGYDDWSAMDEQTDNAVWRILARCWPNTQTAQCSWSNNNTTLSYSWHPHSDSRNSDAPWLPSGLQLVNPAFNSNGTTKQACISFDVFDQAGNVSYAPSGTQCATASQAAVIELPLKGYLPLVANSSLDSTISAASRTQSNLINDNGSRTIYIASTSSSTPIPTNTPTPAPSSNIQVVSINSPATVNPSQRFIPEITVRLLNSQQLLESRGDMLRHYSGTNYSTFPHIGVVGSVNSGQTYTFRFYNDYPFVAPSSNGNYESVWRIWANGQWVGPEIPIRFTVGTTNNNNAPGAPTLRSPYNWIEVRSVQAPELCWNAVNDPDGDAVEYWAEVYESATGDNSGWITGTCWRPNNLNGKYALYKWHVKARDSRGGESGWSTDWHFTLSPPPNNPIRPTSTPQATPATAVVTGNWWDSAYAFRRLLPITANETLPAGLVIKVDTLDLNALVTEGKARSDYNDVRIVRRLSQTSWQEVARRVYTSWDIEFQLLTAIAPGIDNSYYIYYGNSNAGASPTFPQPSSGWWVEMYNDKWWTSWVTTVEFDRTIDFDNVCSDPIDHDGRTGSGFDDSDLYRGRLYIPTTGTWTFRSYTNDGYALSINGQQVGRFDGYDGSRWAVIGSISLKAGWHTFEAPDMWVNCGPWKLAMEGPGFGNQIIPREYYQKQWGNIRSGSNPGSEEPYALPTPTPTETFTPVPPILPMIYGSGVDGDINVANGQTVTINSVRSRIVTRANAGTRTVTVESANGFAVGDEVLAIAMRLFNAGYYDLNKIVAISGNTLTLDTNLRYRYDAGNEGYSQVIRIPQYRNVTVQAGGILTAPAWDGTLGGVLIFRANGTTSIAGTLQMRGGNGQNRAGDQQGGGSGGGYRGGNNSVDGSAAYSGEGAFGGLAETIERNHNAGGGAGGTAYGLNDGAGGANGSNGENGSNGAQGGYAFGSDMNRQIFMGGGGGGGRNDTGTGAGGGGAGGGIMMIFSNNINVTGSLNADGGNGGDGGSDGGGGAGGAILIKSGNANLGSQRVTAYGGNGPGSAGNGGHGRIWVEWGTACSCVTYPPAESAQVLALIPTATPTHAHTITPTKTWTPTNTPVPPPPTITPTWTATWTPTQTPTPIPVPITPISSNSGELITSWEAGAGTWHLNSTSGAQSATNVAQYASEGTKAVKLAFTNNPGWSHFQYNFPATLDLSSYGKLQLHVINPGTPLTIKVSVPTGPNWAWHVSPGQSVPFGSKLVEFDLRANNWTIDSSTRSIANLNQAQGLVILIEGAQTPNALYVDNLRKLPVTTANILYLSTSANGTVSGIKYADEDVLAFNLTTRTWSLVIDGSDIGLASFDIDAVDLQPDGTFLLSLDKDGTIPGYGAVGDEDILRFTPTSLGNVTAGRFSMYFDGSDVELTTSAEDVDAFTVLADGRLLISTLGNAKVTGVTAQDKDLLVFTPSTLGPNTAGTWALYFDGSDVGLTTAQEDIWGVNVGTGNTIYLTTLGPFAVNGLKGDGADIFICTASALGDTTACTFSMYWDGSANGLGGKSIDAFDIADATILQDASFVAGIDENQNDLEVDDDELNGDSELSDVVDEMDEVHIFLPFVSR